MGDETTLGVNVRLLEPANGPFGVSNVVQNVGLLVFASGVSAPSFAPVTSHAIAGLPVSNVSGGRPAAPPPP